MSEQQDENNNNNSQISKNSNSLSKGIKNEEQLNLNNISQNNHSKANSFSHSNSYQENNKSNVTNSKVNTEKINNYSTNVSKDSLGNYKSKPHFEAGEHTIDSKGKFMEINPHFGIIQKNINDLKDGIYNNTKKSLILKGSIQNSKNYIKQNSNRVYKSIVDKLYDIRQLFKKEMEKQKDSHLENMNLFSGVIEYNKKLKEELNQCEIMLNHCENQIGYKLLRNPCYSFLNTNDKKEGMFNNKTSFN
jgi:hypothetical protein